MKLALVTVLACAALPQPAMAREQIRIVGSGTVYPFVTTAAEQFGQGGRFHTPIVESTGTGGGFKLFCEGVGMDKPDINDASRKITDSEKELCLKNGVTGIAEITIGHDGIVIANKKGATLLNLTKKDLFMALARELPDKNGKPIKNRYQSWKEIDPNLPDQPIAIYGPPPTSGTRDAFVEMVMEKGCEQFSAFTAIYPDTKERKKACHLIREDGKYIESGEDYNIVVQKLTADDKALGIMGYNFYDENATQIQASLIEGVAPGETSIESGKYGVSRNLYVYVKKQHIGMVPGIVEFIRELTSENAIGPDGYITAKGLLPLNDEGREATHEAVERLSKK